MKFQTSTLLIISSVLFTLKSNAQTAVNVSEALKNLNQVEYVYFDKSTSNEKKLFKKWNSHSEITRVKICDTYDSAKTERLLKAIANNDNIDAIDISVGSRSQLPNSLSKLSQIRSLKIYNSPNISQENLDSTLVNFKDLSIFSWINNKSVLQIDVSSLVPNLKSIEIMDTTLDYPNPTISNFISNKNLENISICFGKKTAINLSQLQFSNGIKLSLINYEIYKRNSGNLNFLQFDEEPSTNLTFANKSNTHVEYYNGSEHISPEELSFIEKKWGTIKKWETEVVPSSVSQTTATTEQTIDFDYSSRYNHVNPSVNPPIKDLVLPKTTYTVQSNQITTLTRKNGTKIEIPADAFVDQNGNPVQGEIKITYKEYMDPLSIFASGIPMFIDSAGTKKTFTSAGMFEIYAFKGENELQLKNGKQINLEFASINDGKNYNFYQFDESQKTWKKESGELEKKEIDRNQQTNNFTQVLMTYNSPIQYSNNSIGQYNFDTTCFDARYQNLNYFNLIDSCKMEGKVEYSSMYYELEHFNKLYHIRYRQYEPKNLVRICYVEKPTLDTIKHALFSFNSNSMLKKFPELKPFYGYVFYSEDFEKYRHLKDHYFKNKIYSDIRVEYNKGDDFCTFILKSKEGFVELKANIADVNKGKVRRYTIVTFNRKFLTYQKILKNRELDFNNYIQRKKIAFNRNRNRSNSVPRARTFTEDSTNYGLRTWYKPVNAKRRAELVKTGLYNCDVQFEPVRANIIDANFKNERDSNLQIDKIYVFDKDMNGYLTFNTKKIMLNPETTMGIIAATASGLIYYINSTGLKNKDFNNKSVDLNMEESTKNFKSIKDLAKIFK